MLVRSRNGLPPLRSVSPARGAGPDNCDRSQQTAHPNTFSDGNAALTQDPVTRRKHAPWRVACAGSANTSPTESRSHRARSDCEFRLGAPFIALPHGVGLAAAAR